MRVARPGQIVGTLNVRSHTAVVDIPYSTKSYSITYSSSQNLKYDEAAGTIHSNYNGWIQRLENTIRSRISALSPPPGWPGAASPVPRGGSHHSPVPCTP
jgi:hypothetical protein